MSNVLIRNEKPCFFTDCKAQFGIEHGIGENTQESFVEFLMEFDAARIGNCDREIQTVQAEIFWVFVKLTQKWCENFQNNPNARKIVEF